MGGCASQPVHPSYVAAQEAELERFRGTPRCPGPVPTTEARQPEEAWESPSGDGALKDVMVTLRAPYGNFESNPARISYFAPVLDQVSALFFSFW